MNIQVEMDEREWLHIVSIIAQATNPYVAKISQQVAAAQQANADFAKEPREVGLGRDEDRRSGNSHAGDRR